jgi:hypothetical protein
MVGLLLGARVAITGTRLVPGDQAACGRCAGGQNGIPQCLPVIDGVIMEPIQAAEEPEPLRL